MKKKYILLVSLLFFALDYSVKAQEINLEMLSQSLITGNYTSFVAQGNYGFASTGYGFKIFDITRPECPVEIHHFPTDGYSMGLNVQGDYLFICDWNGGLIVYDISDMDNPFITDSYDTPGFIRTVLPYQNYLFLAAENSGIQVIDFSNPYDLDLVHIVNLSYEPNDIALQEQYLYISVGISGLVIYNITNPENPQYAGNWNTFGGNARGLYIYPPEDRLLLSDGDNGHYILNISTPQSPFSVGQISLPTYSAADAGAINNIGIGSYFNFGLIAFNMSGSLMDSIELGLFTGTICTYNGYTYACMIDSGLKVVDSEPSTNLTVVWDTVNVGQPFQSEVMGDIAYIANSDAGLTVMDVSDRSNPILVESIPTGLWAKDVIISPDSQYLYVADFYSGVLTFSLSDPLHPVLVNTTSAEPDTGAHSLALYGNTLFLAIYGWEFNTFDITNPANPVLLDYSANPTRFFRNIAVTEDGNYLYACAEESGVMVYRIYAPDSVEYDFTLDYFITPYDIAIRGNYAYIADFDSYLYVLDISNPYYIFKLDSLAPDDEVSSVDLIDNTHLAMCDWSAGFEIVDISNPLNISVIAEKETPGFTHSASTDGRYLYICDHFDFIIYDLYSPNSVPSVENTRPSKCVLFSNYPNPFNSETKFYFEIPFNAYAELKVYNIVGEEIASLAQAYFPMGSYQFPLDADRLTSGIYLAVLKVDQTKYMRKIVLLK